MSTQPATLSLNQPCDNQQQAGTQHLKQERELFIIRDANAPANPPKAAATIKPSTTLISMPLTFCLFFLLALLNGFGASVPTSLTIEYVQKKGLRAPAVSAAIPPVQDSLHAYATFIVRSDCAYAAFLLREISP